MTYTKPVPACLVATHEPGYWRAQAAGFRLIRMFEKYLTLSEICGRLIREVSNYDLRDFFRLERDRLNAITQRIARQLGRTNGYTILSARAEDSPAYRVVVQRQPIALAGDLRIEQTPQFIALKQFRADAQQLAKEEMRATAGATYELYARRFSGACAHYIADLDPQLQPYAVAIALYHGYVEDEEERYADFGEGYCSITGIDEHYCHCGSHP